MRMDWKDKPVEKNKTYLSSFEFALSGLKTAFKEERNMKTHGITGSIVFILGLIFQLNRLEWCWLFVAIFSVIVTELINTSFENLVDLVTKQHFHPLAKKVKDMAAAAVFVTALFAFLIGAFLFLPKIWYVIQQYR